MVSETSLYCGLKWTAASRVLAVVDGSGEVVLVSRIDGLSHLPALLAEAGDTEARRLPIAVRDRPDWLGALLHASGRDTSEVPAGRDAETERSSSDAVLLARQLRQGLGRPVEAARLAPDSLALRAWAHQSAVWTRTSTAARLLMVLKVHYPAFVRAFGDTPNGLTGGAVRAALALMPSPGEPGTVAATQLAAVVDRAGWFLTLQEAVDLKAQLTQRGVRHLPLVERGIRRQVIARLCALDDACSLADGLGDLAETAYQRYLS